ncbi:MAG TPA: AMP-binding protein [Beijerinckiaceae bacterium]|nr:AMP-binding protein [Beijerinckiaceae bacterium]
MPGYLDRYEIRTPKSRESALFRDLKGILSVAKARAPGLRRQLAGIDLAQLKNRADLARIPVLRSAEVARMQSEAPPLGGLAGSRAGAAARLLASGSSTFVPEGHAKDWWSAARAMNAAGFERGDIVLNCHSYHLNAMGRIVESGAHALGCAVIPAGESELDRLVKAIARLRPNAYCGQPEFLKNILIRFRQTFDSTASINKALFIGAGPSAALEDALRRKAIRVQRCYGKEGVGVIAYQTRLKDGAIADEMVVNEGIIVEIVKPDTNAPVPFGVVGEVVVTRLNSDYPLLRFATGDLAALLPGPSPCGRTNLRFRGGLGRVEHASKQSAEEQAKRAPAGARRSAQNVRSLAGRPNESRPD